MTLSNLIREAVGEMRTSAVDSIVEGNPEIPVIEKIKALGVIGRKGCERVGEYALAGLGHFHDFYFQVKEIKDEIRQQLESIRSSREDFLGKKADSLYHEMGYE